MMGFLVHTVFLPEKYRSQVFEQVCGFRYECFFSVTVFLPLQPTSRSNPEPSEGVQTAHGPAPRLAEGAMQRQPVQARVGYPAALPSPRLPRPEVRQRV